MEKIFKAKFNVKNVVALIFIVAGIISFLWYSIYRSHDVSNSVLPITKNEMMSIMEQRYRENDSIDSITQIKFYHQIDSILKLKNKNDSNLHYVYNTLIPSYNEKIRSVDTMSNDLVYKFWSDLYEKTKRNN